MLSVLSAGPNAVLKFGTVTAPGQDWSISIDAHLKDCANFLDGRHQVGTLPDADFKCTLFYDTANQPHDPAGFNLVPGAVVTAKCFTDLTNNHFFLFPMTIGKIDISSKIEDVLMYNVEGKQSGAIVYPVVP